MCADIRKTLAKCGACRLFQARTDVVHPGDMPIPYYPHQVVSMDLVGPLPRSSTGHQYIFTLMDHLTGWADAYPIYHKKSSTVVDVLNTR